MLYMIGEGPEEEAGEGGSGLSGASIVPMFICLSKSAARSSCTFRPLSEADKPLCTLSQGRYFSFLKELEREHYLTTVGILNESNKRSGYISYLPTELAPMHYR